MTCFFDLLADLLVLAGLLLACSGGGEDAEPTPAPTETPAGPGTGSPEAALAGFVQTTFSKQFVPDCSKAVVATDAGKVCSSARGERDEHARLRSRPRRLRRSATGRSSRTPAAPGPSCTHRRSRRQRGVPGIPWPLRTGVDVVVAGTGNGLNVRTGPGLNAAAVDRIDDGTVIRLSAGPAPADNLHLVAGRRPQRLGGRRLPPLPRRGCEHAATTAAGRHAARGRLTNARPVASLDFPSADENPSSELLPPRGEAGMRAAPASYLRV